MSEIKTNKISPRRGTTTTIGDSGDSVTISSGTTTTNAGTISTAGITGGTINNTTGTIEGLQQVINWQTGSIKTADFTASANEGYFVNTTSASVTATLPASPSAGDVIAFKDYADTFDTNNLTLAPNGNKIQGSTNDFIVSTEGTAAILLYVDSTKGWLLVDQSKASDIIEGPKFLAATGGTVTTCGNFKIHTFTGPGTFCVSSLGNGPTLPAGGPNNVDYLVVAGGGGSGSYYGGAGGAGGFRESHCSTTSGCYTASPKATSTSISVTATGFPITVGGGGTNNPPNSPGSRGSNSVFSTITSTGGGGGGGGPSGHNGLSGGSGGGGGGPSPSSGGAGNSPPVSPSQGNPGGNSSLTTMGAGGGAAAAGQPGPGTSYGGIGAATNINSSTCVGTPGPSPAIRYFAGGGGGYSGPPGTPGQPWPGGAGGGGHGWPGGPIPSPGQTNTGGGAGADGGPGGSGIVIIRYKYQ
jgi:hypothetical protein